MLKVLYGCCYKGVLNDYGKFDITYIDIIPNLTKPNGRYICQDITTVCFDDYDIILLSPPCNYYSRANYRRDISSYSLKTRYLLPYCLKACSNLNKPYLIENVRNPNLFARSGILQDYCFFVHGRHTFWTNTIFNYLCVPIEKDNIQNRSSNNRQGGNNVNLMFDEFLRQFL